MASNEDTETQLPTVIAPSCETDPDLSDCVVEEPTEVPTGCIETPSGLKCPDTTPSAVCQPFQLQGNRDDCQIENYVDEALGIAGATFNVFKLLGVHEQGKLVDQTGNGNGISSGAATNFPSANAFDNLVSAWRSSQKGDAIIASSYLGYDFGFIKLQNGRTRYGEPKDVTLDVSSLRIKQVNNASNRVTSVRVERSQDGQKWYGVEVVSLPDCAELVTVNFRRSVPSRFWRLRPLTFGGDSTDFWSVVALELIDFEATQITNIQDRLFLENKNRDYQTTAIPVKASYDLIDVTTELSRFGLELPSQSLYIHMSFQACVRELGRPPVIGDIFEVPSETQFSASLEPIKKYLEVTDVGWSTDGYTPGWTPTLLRIIASPMLASQETQDIFGDLVGQEDATGLFDKDDGNHPIFQDYSEIGQTVTEEAVQEERAPQRGRDTGNEVRQFEEEEVLSVYTQAGVDIQKVGLRPNALYVEDGIPPNGLDFTLGDTFPTNPSDTDYHRLTYSGLAEDIPARLYRFSTTKGRWVYLETDRRDEFDGTKKKLQEFITDPSSTPINKITGDE